jgi:SsrA-binding protein
MQQHRGKKVLPDIRNAKARHDFFIEDTYEAGIVLTGTEVKSIRDAKCQITQAFARVEKKGVTLYNAHIEEYEFGNINNHTPTRPRRLLLNAKEIRKLLEATKEKGMTLIPLRVYFKGGLVKVEIGVCRAKKLYDKREDLKKREQMREADRDIQRKLK